METEEIQKLKKQVEVLENFVADFSYSDRYIFQKHAQFLDAKDISFGTSKGTRIGKSVNEKIAFFGATPIVRQAAITAPSIQGATYNQIDVQSIATTVNSLITLLENFGFLIPN